MRSWTRCARSFRGRRSVNERARRSHQSGRTVMRPRSIMAALAACLALAIVSADRVAHAEPGAGEDARARAAAAQAEALVVAMDASSEHVRRLLRKARA